MNITIEFGWWVLPLLVSMGGSVCLFFILDVPSDWISSGFLSGLVTFAWIVLSLVVGCWAWLIYFVVTFFVQGGKFL